MPRRQIMAMVLKQLEDHRAHNLSDVVVATVEESRKANQPVYQSDVRSAVLGLVRQNELELTDNFQVQIPASSLATV